MLLRVLAAWFFTGIYWIAVALVQAATLKRLPRMWVHEVMRFWGRSVLRLLGLELRILNESTMEERAARVMVFNHQSALDMCWVAAIFPPAPLAIGKKQLIWVPFVNLAWWALDFIRIDRRNPRKAMAGLETAIREITANRRTLIIAPEGTRTLDGGLLPFKSGAFRIAVKSQAPICPVVVSGAFELLAKGGALPRRGVITVSYLPPIETLGIPESGVNELMGRVREAMVAAYEAQR